MRFRPVLLSLALVPALALALQGQDKPKPLKKGDSVMIKGCLRGSAVEGAETMRRDAEGEARRDEDVPVLTYRLEGKKDLLKELKEQYDKKTVEVRGILRSDLSGAGMGTTVGNTRIAIGLDPRTSRSPHGTDQAVPVLEVTAFDGSSVSCAR
jgi:hypothetical protein